MNFKRLLNTWLGRFFISVILGLGIACLFRKVCNDKNCLIFNGPILSEMDDKIYKYGEKCYTYTVTPTTCDEKKKIIDIREPLTEEEKKLAKNENTHLTSAKTPSSSIFPLCSS